MKKYQIIILVLVAIAVVIGVIFLVVGVFRPKGAGILVETAPSASVFIDGVLAGKTPYEEIRDPGEIVVKLVPESFERPLAPYETKVALESGVQTVVRWEFGEDETDASGEIISFEKGTKNETSLSVVTIPNSAEITVDGGVRGFAPYKTSTLAPGEHSLSIGATGYNDRSVRLKTHAGYKLTVIAQLSKSDTPPEEPPEEVVEEEEQEEKVVEVEILSTPTGFLRVRAEPSTLGEEIGRVAPGEKYLFIKKDEKTGWFKIEYEEGEEGWVSNTYSKLAEEEEEAVTPTVTPTKTLTPSPSI